MAELSGQSFAGYEIIAKLGEGGMGAVYKARQPKLDRIVALKVMSSDLALDPDFVARFKREANAAASLNHENVVQVFSAGEFEGGHFIAMEFVEGTTLRQHIESRGRLDAREAVAVTVYVAKALQYAWNKARLIHRDIKPENIFLSNAGEVKVGDLGLAKTVGGETTSLTQTGMMMGSPNYISPEQARGVSDIDFRTDIYSLGCTLFHMLTGRPPYSGSDPLVVITKHVNDPPPAIFKVWPTCPMPLALALGKMLTKNRNARHQSYEDLIEQLQGVHDKLKPAAATVPISASEPTQVLTPTPKPAATTPALKLAVAKTPKPAKSGAESRGSRVVIGVGALAAVALIAGAVWWFAGGTPSRGIAVPEGYTPLFNGKDLAGWEGRPEFWSVQDGAICGATTKEARAQKNTFLVCTASEFGDFELRAQFKLAAGDEQGVVNTGIQYRSQIIDREYFTLSGYQADLGFSSKKNLSGGFWEEAGRSVPATPGQRLILREGASPQSPKKTIESIGSTDDILASYKENDWNDLTVIASGNRLQHYLNGKLASEVIDETAAAASTGTLALQIKTGPPMRVWFRNLFIKRLGSAASSTPSLQSSAVPAAAGWQNAINLLPLIDPQKDAVAGEWTFEKGELVGDKDGHARIEISYQPPEEYDYRVAFTVEGGATSGAGQILSKAGHDFAWVCFANHGTVFGFDTVGGKSIHQNPTRTEGSPLQKRRRYVSLVTVRNDGVRGYLDGGLIVEWKTNYADMGIRDNIWKLRTSGVLGVGCQHRIVFHRIEVREVTGKGTFTRGAPSAASTTPTLQHSNPPAPWLSAFCAEVAALPAEQQVARVVAKLKELNPGFDGKEGHKIENGIVSEFSFRSTGVTNISPVRALSKLEGLGCAGFTGPVPKGEKSPLEDLSPLRRLPLRWLNCSYSRVADLSPLRGMPLEILFCHDTQVKDFTPLQGMPLKELVCFRVPISDLTPLNTLHLLEELICGGSPVRDLSPLKGLRLRKLSLGDTPVSDLSPLAGVPLKELYVVHTRVSDLSPLRGAPLEKIHYDAIVNSRAENMQVLKSIPTLQTINGQPSAEFWKKAGVAETPGNSPTNIQPSLLAPWLSAFCAEVAALPAEQQVARVVAKLKELNPGFDTKSAKHKVNNGQVTRLEFASSVRDISPVRALADLREFVCYPGQGENSPLADLSPLKGLRLTLLTCVCCQVSDLSPVAGMPIKILVVPTTRVSDLSPVKNMPLTTLDCGNTPVSDLTPIPGKAITTLKFPNTKVTSFPSLKGMPLAVFDCRQTGVTSLAPLAEIAQTLKNLRCDFNPDRDAALVRSFKRLEAINDLPPAEFWKKVEAGEVPKAK